MCCSYIQAEVEGQKITWLTPHTLQQVLTDDVDFNVMLTFLEFYEVRFDNFRISILFTGVFLWELGRGHRVAVETKLGLFHLKLLNKLLRP